MNEMVRERVREVLAAAEEPLSAGHIQRRIAAGGLDVATGAIREACTTLREAGEVEAVGEDGRERYRLADGE